MSDLDPYDDDLANALRRRAGSSTRSVAEVHGAVIARAGRVRRRRAVVAGGGALAALVAIGIAVLPGDAPGTIAPADSGEPVPSVERPDTSRDPIDGAVTTSTTVDTSIPQTDPPPTSPSVAAPEAATTPPVPTPTVGSTDVPRSTTTAAAVTTVPASTIPASTGEPAPEPAFTRTYDSLGGSITVSWDGSRLALLEVAPRPGFVAETKDATTTRIRVDFDDGDRDSRIEVRRDGNDVTVSIS